MTFRVGFVCWNSVSLSSTGVSIEFFFEYFLLLHKESASTIMIVSTTNNLKTMILVSNNKGSSRVTRGEWFSKVMAARCTILNIEEYAKSLSEPEGSSDESAYLVYCQAFEWGSRHQRPTSDWCRSSRKAIFRERDICTGDWHPREQHTHYLACPLTFSEARILSGS
jgi:hypothetical protein